MNPFKSPSPQEELKLVDKALLKFKETLLSHQTYIQVYHSNIDRLIRELGIDERRTWFSHIVDAIIICIFGSFFLGAGLIIGIVNYDNIQAGLQTIENLPIWKSTSVP